MIVRQLPSAAPPIRRHDVLPHGEIASPLRHVKLSLLKGFELTCNGAGVPLSQGSQHLLAFLALHKRAQRRTHVASVLWDDVTDRRAAGNLRSALWRMNHLGLDLVGGNEQYVSLSATVAVDVYEAERMAKQVLNPSADAVDIDLDALAIAGELLPGWSDDWVLLERERLRQIRLHMLDALSERWIAAGSYQQAILAALAAVASEPLHESSQRALIKAFLAEGNPTEAVRRFDMYRVDLWRDMRLEPSPRILELLAAARARVTHG